MHSEPIKETIQHLQKALSFLGKANVTPKKDNYTIYYRFESEFPPVQKMKLKVETHCREHFSILGWQQKPFSVNSSWFNGECNLTTYRLEELLGTKLRALYQRKKGRDLFDLWKAIQYAEINPDIVVLCYKEYMNFSLKKPIPTKKEFLKNLEGKMTDSEFLGGTVALLLPNEKYNQQDAFDLVNKFLIELM